MNSDTGAPPQTRISDLLTDKWSVSAAILVTLALLYQREQRKEHQALALAAFVNFSNVTIVQLHNEHLIGAREKRHLEQIVQGIEQYPNLIVKELECYLASAS